MDCSVNEQMKLDAITSLINIKRKGTSEKTLTNALQRRAKESAKAKGALTEGGKAIVYYEFLSNYDVNSDIEKYFYITPDKVIMNSSGCKAKLFKGFSSLFLYDFTKLISKSAWSKMTLMGIAPLSWAEEEMRLLRGLKGAAKNQISVGDESNCIFFIKAFGDDYELSVKPDHMYSKKLPRDYKATKSAMNAAERLLGEPIDWKML